MPRSSQNDFKSKNAIVEKVFTFIINISFKNSRKRYKYYNIKKFQYYKIAKTFR